MIRAAFCATRSAFDFSSPSAGFGVGGVDRPATVSHVRAQAEEDERVRQRTMSRASRMAEYLSERVPSPQRRGPRRAGRLSSMPARPYQSH